MIANPSYKATGCGCGGSGTLSAAPCGCGGTDCPACQGQGIVRPRFFAGQLLTEDDLQLLTDYVGHKNRLHNRRLFGAGVVCGLEVSCHPCGKGQVIVHPGYALDCCGNDLMLACAQALDIPAMIRNLRRDQLGGYDCGDPCPDPEELAATNPQVGERTNGQQDAVLQPAKPNMRYCLYLRYCEQSSDPVMPYSTGDECGSVACEPTRVREGVKFELRCRPADAAANPLIQRLCACVGDVRRFLNVLNALGTLGSHTAVAQAALAKDPAAFQFETVSFMEQADRELEQQIKNFRENPSKSIPTELILAVRDTAFLVNRFEVLAPADKAKFLQTNRELGGILERTKAAINQAIEVTSKEAVPNFNAIRDWLIERLSQSPFLSDCTLRERVYAVPLPMVTQASEDRARIVVAENRPLIEAFINYLRDCVCRVVNPACVPCDDAGVVLACLEVGDCEVVKVCNLERTFVISPAAVRYWLPPLQLLGNLFERFCCDSLDPLFTEDPNRLLGNLLNEEIKRMLFDSRCTGEGNLIGTLIDQLFQRKESPRPRVMGTVDASPVNEQTATTDEKEKAAEPIEAAAQVTTTAAPAPAKAETEPAETNGNDQLKNGEKPASKKSGLPKTKTKQPAKNSAGGEK